MAQHLLVAPGHRRLGVDPAGRAARRRAHASPTTAADPLAAGPSQPARRTTAVFATADHSAATSAAPRTHRWAKRRSPSPTPAARGDAEPARGYQLAGRSDDGLGGARAADPTRACPGAAGCGPARPSTCLRRPGVRGPAQEVAEGNGMGTRSLVGWALHVADKRPAHAPEIVAHGSNEVVGETGVDGFAAVPHQSLVLLANLDRSTEYEAVLNLHNRAGREPRLCPPDTIQRARRTLWITATGTRHSCISTR